MQDSTVKKLAIAATGVACAVAGMQEEAQATNLIQNGGFENPEVPENVLTYVKDLPGWSMAVCPPEVSHCGTVFEINNMMQNTGSSFEGLQNLELDSNGVTGIVQDIPTTPGQTYRLLFAFSPLYRTADNHLAIRWNGTLLDELSASGVELTGTDWKIYSYDVTAEQATSQLQFDNFRERSNGSGSILDAVTLVAMDPNAELLNFTLTGEFDETSVIAQEFTDLNNNRFEARFSYFSDIPDLYTDPTRGLFLLDNFEMTILDELGEYATLSFEDDLTQAFLEVSSYNVRVRPARVNRVRRRPRPTARLAFSSAPIARSVRSCSTFSDTPAFASLDLEYDQDFANPNVAPTSAPTGPLVRSVLSLFNEFTPTGSSQSRVCEKPYDQIVVENPVITRDGDTEPEPEPVPEPGMAIGLGLIGFGWLMKQKHQLK